MATPADDTEPPPAQGWYLDPFSGYEQRWFSHGVPTSLVRDADGKESEHSPADGVVLPATTELVRGPERPLADGADLLRADAATAADQPSPDKAAGDALDRSGLWSAAGG